MRQTHLTCTPTTFAGRHPAVAALQSVSGGTRKGCDDTDKIIEVI